MTDNGTSSRHLHLVLRITIIIALHHCPLMMMVVMREVVRACGARGGWMVRVAVLRGVVRALLCVFSQQDLLCL